uniref:NAD(P)H-quinone oxidoreductase subunit 5, chloroplastic n=1 Tax=Stegnogramma sagittifolia TaxID=1132989 RepID=A0A248RFD5_9MONI|nr:NADH-plastoquinone oxidoreductase subunit 5 [Stegnogramma sagittifolia]ASU96145.1 NADH-plastoquinone oxidoreductase subunit 5 [Stegnogramma sagittifolia]
MPVELPNQYACLIPPCPLAASRSTGSLSFFFPKAARSLRRLCAIFNTFSLITAMFVSLAPFRQQAATHSIQQYLWARIPKSDFRLKIGFLIDPLTLTMSILVTTVGISVMVYSDSYTCHDQGYVRFYAYLSLFAASMLGLVFSPNLIQIYFFWELVGMCSYLLIGFWFARSSAANACQKAFVTNRIGDFGLLLGVSGVYWITGSFEIFELCDRFFELNNRGAINPIFANTTALLLFLGPVAKSAQFPLHIWLPDAMEGPTPISALIHAATMVAAGIFFIARIFSLISILPPTMYTTSWVGGVTTLPGATLALAQKDLKRGLAYSTMSQLGYMVPASGIGASQSALFHLITHAYSKALSFLGSGSVIHSMEKVVGYSPTRSQNMFLMGGLRKHMPITGTTSLLGTLSLCGIPPLSCFWSKDQIITESWLRSPYLGLATSTTAGLTAFHTSRIYLLTFEGNFRANQTTNVGFNNCIPTGSSITLWGGAKPESLTTKATSDTISAANTERSGVTETRNLITARPPEGDSIREGKDQTHFDRNQLHPQESNSCMVFPLIVLAIPTVFAGLVGVGVDPIGKGISLDFLLDWLISIPSFSDVNKRLEFLAETLTSSIPSLSLSLVGLLISLEVYGQNHKIVDTKIFGKLINKSLLSTFVSSMRSWSINRGYIDYYYKAYFIRSIVSLSKLVLHFDRWIIDGFTNGTGASSLLGGESMRHGKNGRISQYLLGLVIGIGLLMLVVDFPIPPLP